jgi:hypothetical protein
MASFKGDASISLKIESVALEQVLTERGALQEARNGMTRDEQRSIGSNALYFFTTVIMYKNTFNLWAVNAKSISKETWYRPFHLTQCRSACLEKKPKLLMQSSGCHVLISKLSVAFPRPRASRGGSSARFGPQSDASACWSARPS